MEIYSLRKIRKHRVYEKEIFPPFSRTYTFLSQKKSV
jgi:hypothetical protein